MDTQDKTGAARPVGFVLWFEGVHVFRQLLDVKRLYDDEEGQDLVEYALLVGFIAVASVLAVSALGSSIANLFWSSAAGKLS